MGTYVPPDTTVKKPYTPPPKTAPKPAYVPPPPLPSRSGTSSAIQQPRANTLPLDPVYEQQLSNARLGYQNTLADLTQQNTQIQSEYGFTDTSNPFNRAAMLQRAYQQGQSGTLNSMASRGQLYSGALQSGLNEGTHQYQQNYQGLRQSYTADLDRLRRARLSAEQGYRETQTGAYADRLQRAFENRPEDPGQQSGSQPPDYAKQYARLDAIRGFLHRHPNLRRKDPARYRRLIREATHLKSFLPRR